jgi:hypothetical protein
VDRSCQYSLPEGEAAVIRRDLTVREDIESIGLKKTSSAPDEIGVLKDASAKHYILDLRGGRNGPYPINESIVKLRGNETKSDSLLSI